MQLTDLQIQRYSRQLLLKQIGLKGQQQLLSSKVLVIGAGGLGSPVLFYLAAAGIGTICIADFDKVDLSNLQRQFLHSTDTIGLNKTSSAKSALEKLNPEICIITFEEKVSAKNIIKLIEPYDIVVDCTDSARTKFLVNDACVLSKKPFVHGGILGFSGQLMTYVPGQGPCYRCIFSQPDDFDSVSSCRDVGVIGAVAGVIGSMQALEVIKFLLGKGQLLVGKMYMYNALTLESNVLKLPANNPDCPVCASEDFCLDDKIYNEKCKFKDHI